MVISDIPAYVSQFKLDADTQREAIEKCEKQITIAQENDIIRDFTIEYGDKIIGAVATQAYGKYLSDGIVVIDIPSRKYKYLSVRVKDIFIKLLRNTYLYDDVVFSRTLELHKINIGALKKIPISCWKTRTTSV